MTIFTQRDQVMKRISSNFTANVVAIIGVIATLLGMVKIDEDIVKIFLGLIFLILLSYIIYEFLSNRRDKKYDYLIGKWNAYHITKDSEKSISVYWQKGMVVIEKISSSAEVRAKQYDLNDADDQYTMKGSVSKGRIFGSGYFLTATSRL